MGGIDWELLKSASKNVHNLEPNEVEDVYQNIAGVTRLRQRDKSVEKLELIFTLCQKIMIEKWEEVKNLEEKLEQQQSPTSSERSETKRFSDDSVIPYDWSSKWKIRKKELEEKLIEKNIEIDILIRDKQRLEVREKTLEEENTELRDNLSRCSLTVHECTQDIDHLKGAIRQYQDKCEENERTIESLNVENFELKNKESTRTHEQTDFNKKLNRRIEKLKEALGKKEVEFTLHSEEKDANLNEEIAKLKHKNLEIIQVLEDKETEVEILRSHLHKATEEIKKNTEFFSTIKTSKREENETEARLRIELLESANHVKRLERQLSQAEDDAQQYAQDLSIVVRELKMYLSGEATFADAVADLKTARADIAARDEKIRELTCELNTIDIDFSALYEENVELRNKLKMEPMSKKISSKKTEKGKSTTEIIQKLTAEVYALQEEKVTLRNKVFDLTRQLSSAKTEIQPTPSIRNIRSADKEVQMDTLREGMAKIYQLITRLTKTSEEHFKHLRSNSRSNDEQKLDHEDSDEPDVEHSDKKIKLKIKRPHEDQKSIEYSAQLDKENLKYEGRLKEGFGSYEEPDGIELSKKDIEERELKEETRKYKRRIENLPLTSQENILKMKFQVKFLLQEVSIKNADYEKTEKDKSNYRIQFKSLYRQILDINCQLNEEKEKWENCIEENRNKERELKIENEALNAKINEIEQITHLDDERVDFQEKLKIVILQSGEHRYESELNRKQKELLNSKFAVIFKKFCDLRNKLNEHIVCIKKLENEVCTQQEINFQLHEKILRLDEISVPMSLHNSVHAELCAVTTKYRQILNERVTEKSEILRLEKLEKACDELELENRRLRDELRSEKERFLIVQNSTNVVQNERLNRDDKVLQLIQQLSCAQSRVAISDEHLLHSEAMLKNIQEKNSELQAHCKELEILNKQLSTQMIEMQQNQIGQTQNFTHPCGENEQLIDENNELKIQVQKFEGKIEVLELQNNFLKTKNDELESRINGEGEKEELKILNEAKLKIAVLSFELEQSIISNKSMRAEFELNILENCRKISKLGRELHDKNTNEQLISNELMNYKERCKYFVHLLNEFRLRLVGSMPLRRQEDMNNLISELSKFKNKLEKDVKMARNDRNEARKLALEMRKKLENFEEFSDALKSETSQTEFVNIWRKKIEEVKIENIYLKEEISILKEERQLIESQYELKENRCVELQEIINRLEILNVQKELLFDRFEVQTRSESRTVEEKIIIDSDDAFTTVPKSFKEVENMNASKEKEFENKLLQLNKELKTSKTELGQALKTVFEDKNLIEKNEKIIKNLENINEEVVNKYESDLKIKIMQIESQNNTIKKLNSVKEIETHRLKIINDGLSERLQITEKALKDYNSNLQSSRNNSQIIIFELRKEISDLKDENEKLSSAVRSFQHDKVLGESNSTNETIKTTSEIQILQDDLFRMKQKWEREQAINKDLEKNIKELELELMKTKQEQFELRQRTEISCELKVQQMQREICSQGKTIKALQDERESMKLEVETLQENYLKQPSLILKKLVEKLRDQLIEKEKQLSILSNMVKDLQEKQMLIDSKSFTDSHKEEPVRDNDSSSFDDYTDDKLGTFEAVFKEPSSNESENQNDQKEIYELENDSKDAQIEELKSRIEDLESLIIAEREEVKRREESVACPDSLKTELKQIRERLTSATNKYIKLEKSNLLLKKNNEELTKRMKLFIETSKEESEAQLNRRKKSAEEVKENVMKWEVKKRLETTNASLKMEVTELNNSLKMMEEKLNISRKLLEKSEKEKLRLNDKVQKYDKLTSNAICSICFKNSNMDIKQRQGFGSTYTIEGGQNTELRSTFTVEKPSKDLLSENEETKCDSCDSITQDLKIARNSLKDVKDKLKGITDANHNLEKTLANALEEIKLLKEENNRLKDNLKSITTKTKSFKSGTQSTKTLPGMTGASLILNYENKIEQLESNLREKCRILDHVKEVLQQALIREEKLIQDKESLLQKTLLLESVKSDTPHDKLLSELRKAKLSIVHLQRELEKLNSTETST